LIIYNVYNGYFDLLSRAKAPGQRRAYRTPTLSIMIAPAESTCLNVKVPMWIGEKDILRLN